jgi:hypothetical protein
MATPHVAGVAGLIATVFPDASPEKIKTRILANVDVIPALAGKVLSGGRLNAARALEDDSVAPGAPGSVLTTATWNSLEVAWTHSADDGLSGGPVAFSEVRWTDADGRAMAHRVKGGSVAAGNQASLPIMPSDKARDLEVQVVEIDNAANVSAPSTVQVQVPAARVAALTWVSDGKWGQVDTPDRPGVWTDSPMGNYAGRENSSLTSQPFRLEGKGSQLSFEARYRLEPGADAVEIEIREAGAPDWKSLHELTSYREWRRETVDLSDYDGKTVELRFRLHSDGARSEEGVYLDRIVVAGS